MAINQQDIEDAIDTIIGEAVGGGETGMNAVAHVIVNRANLRGKSVGEIVRAPNQFDGYSNPGSSAKAARDNASTRAIALRVLNGAISGQTADPTDGADHFVKSGTKASWAKNMTQTSAIGGNTFYQSSGAGKSTQTALQAATRVASSDSDGPVSTLSSYLVKGKPQSYITGLNEDMGSRLQALYSSAPDNIRKNLRIRSGARSVELQTQLWDAAVKKYGSESAARKWVAPPGKSQHNIGNATDLGFGNAETKKWVHDNAADYGLHFRLGNEPWHIEPIPDWEGSLPSPRVAPRPADTQSMIAARTPAPERTQVASTGATPSRMDPVGPGPSWEQFQDWDDYTKQLPPVTSATPRGSQVQFTAPRFTRDMLNPQQIKNTDPFSSSAPIESYPSNRDLMDFRFPQANQKVTGGIDRTVQMPLDARPDVRIPLMPGSTSAPDYAAGSGFRQVPQDRLPPTGALPLDPNLSISSAQGGVAGPDVNPYGAPNTLVPPTSANVPPEQAALPIQLPMPDPYRNNPYYKAGDVPIPQTMSNTLAGVRSGPINAPNVLFPGGDAALKSIMTTTKPTSNAGFAALTGRTLKEINTYRANKAAGLI